MSFGNLNKSLINLNKVNNQISSSVSHESVPSPGRSKFDWMKSTLETVVSKFRRETAKKSWNVRSISERSSSRSIVAEYHRLRHDVDSGPGLGNFIESRSDQSEWQCDNCISWSSVELDDNEVRLLEEQSSLGQEDSR